MKQSKISRRSFLLGLGAVSAAAVLTACGGSSSTAASGSAASGSSVVYRTLDEIKASGTINIGVFSDKNPFGYVDENGEYQGYDVYFGNRLGEDLGVEINYVSTEAANRIEYLQTGKVDVILANFTVTPERAEEVDFALPYMNVALGVISPDSAVVTTLDNWNADDQMIVISGTTAETYLTKEYPDIPLQKYDSYATAKNALENGNGVAWANDNTEVIAFANQNPGYTVGIASLGSQDTIAPAVSQGNTTVLDWLNEEIRKLGEDNFFHKDYEATLVDTYGIDYEDELVVEGGVAAGADASSEAASSEAASVAEGEGYTGTQTASAKGMNGDVTVTITFENGVATACDVDASTETESLGQAAAPTVADAIVAGNTPNVDAVSGSTVTSNAIMEAAKACYDAAGIAY